MYQCVYVSSFVCVCNILSQKYVNFFSTQSSPISTSFPIIFYKRKNIKHFFPKSSTESVPLTLNGCSWHLIYNDTDRKKNIQLFSYLEILSKIFTCCTQVNMNIININYFDEFSDNTLTAVTGTAAVMIN